MKVTKGAEWKLKKGQFKNKECVYNILYIIIHVLNKNKYIYISFNYIYIYVYIQRSFYKYIKGTFRRLWLWGISNHQHMKIIKAKYNQPTNQNDSSNVVPKKTLLEDFPTTEVTDQLNTVELDFAIPLPPAWSGGAQSGPAKGRHWIGGGGWGLGCKGSEIWGDVGWIAMFEAWFSMIFLC